MARIIDQVRGHRATLERLVRAVREERLAHTFLFVGPSGIGKKLSAFAIAQALVCERESPPCGSCASCLRVEKRQSESVMFVEPEGAQIKIEQARDIRKFLALRNIFRSRLIIIDEAHKMNPQAANALLKVIEEPPEGSFFVLVAPSVSGVLPTIRSRSQVIRFAPLSKEDLQVITGASDWVLESAQGRVDLVEELSEEDVSELRLNAFAAWDQLLKRQRVEAMDRVQGDFRTRESSLFITKCWQQILRDARFWHDGVKKVIHGDQGPLIERLSALPVESIDQLYHGAFGLEGDIIANVDRTLSLEAYFYDVDHVIAQAL